MIRSDALLGLASVLLVAGCASAGTSSSSPSVVTSSASVRTVTVTVAGRKVTPTPGRVAVRVGEPVRLTVTSDVANEVHVHGVDVERELTAGRPSTFTVTNDQPGIYEVELHHPALLLFQFVVT